MSKNISIQEGGIGKQLTVDKLKTNLVGGGSCLWVPEDGINLGTKHISENGTFRASDDGYLGYSEVTVSGVGTATGRDPTTGEEKRVSVDPETGDLEETIIPKSIRITTLPTKVNYTNGERINYSGIVVHAYSSTGQDLGAVPFNELVFPVTTALASGDEWTDGQGLNAMQIAYVPTWRRDVSQSGKETEVQVFCCTEALGTDMYGRSCSFGGDGPATLFVTRYNGQNYAACIAGDRKVNQYSYFNGDATPYGYLSYGWRGTGSTTAKAGDRVFSRASFDENITQLPVSTVNPTSVNPSTLHTIQTIPVQWPSADAGTTLETSFTINVTGGST